MTPGSELSGKVALVTGGSRNIGRAISRSLAAGGATVEEFAALPSHKFLTEDRSITMRGTK
jgi:nucleoside-diphosphate-sugar epimerase